MVQIKGIDVSHWQGDIDWPKVAADGVKFVFIKATQGVDFIDDKFAGNVKGAYAAGIKVGAYHYATFGSVAEANAEADHLLNIVSNFNINYPLVLDLEEDRKKVGKKVLTDGAIAFLEKIENAGYFAMLYSGKSFLENQLDEGRLRPYAFWVARYGKTLGRDAHIWQYTSEGKVKGINGNVDMNWAYADFTHGTDGPVEKPKPEPKPASKLTYTVKPGDSLTEIAQEHGTTVASLVALNAIKDPNLIFPGQVLKLSGTVKPTPKPAPKPVYHVVKRGDTVSEIAAKYKTTVKEIAALNKLRDPDVIYANQRLRVK
jgi:lysozyme